MAYICNNPKCKAVKISGVDRVVVKAVMGKFIHPHLDRQDGMVCPYCGYPVYLSDGKVLA